MRVMVSYVDPHFFDALDVELATGRPLLDADNRPPAGDALIVLSRGVWHSLPGGESTRRERSSMSRRWMRAWRRTGASGASSAR